MPARQFQERLTPKLVPSRGRSRTTGRNALERTALGFQSRVPDDGTDFG